MFAFVVLEQTEMREVLATELGFGLISRCLTRLSLSILVIIVHLGYETVSNQGEHQISVCTRETLGCQTCFMV